MKMHMIDLLMRQPAIILQDIIVFGTEGFGDFFGDGQEFGEVVVGDVG